MTLPYAFNFIFTSDNEPLADRIILQRIREAREHLPRARTMICTNGDYLKLDYLAELAAGGKRSCSTWQEDPYSTGSYVTTGGISGFR